MEINKIELVGDLTELVTSDTRNSVENVSFEEHLFNELNQVNNSIVNAEDNIKDLALGKNANLHEVMLSIQKAKLSLEMLMKVRDKALEGIHEVLRMQI